MDIAAEHGHDHLIQVLKPEIKHHVASEVLAGLQRNLYVLISEYDRTAATHLRLPELEVLTELDPPVYWIRVTGGSFIIELRGCELYAEARGKMDYGSSPPYRITPDRIYKPE